MIALRRDAERRHVRHGKENSWHTFYPRDHPGLLTDGFGILAFFDEMRLAPGGVSGPRTHDEAEIVTYVYKGALAHEDSVGGSDVIYAGEFQHMTTGLAIRHKEKNASQTNWAHIFQISLRPSEVGLACAQEHKRFAAAQRRNVLCVVGSPDGRKGSLRIHQDALIFSSILDPGHHLVHQLLSGRSAWLHILYGEATLNDIVLTQGDGLGITNEFSVSLTVRESTEILLIDLCPAPLAHQEAKTSRERPTEESHENRGTNR